jgi:hypothetical protein
MKWRILLLKCFLTAIDSCVRRRLVLRRRYSGWPPLCRNVTAGGWRRPPAEPPQRPRRSGRRRLCPQHCSRQNHRVMKVRQQQENPHD